MTRKQMTRQNLELEVNQAVGILSLVAVLPRYVCF